MRRDATRTRTWRCRDAQVRAALAAELHARRVHRPTCGAGSRQGSAAFPAELPAGVIRGPACRAIQARLLPTCREYPWLWREGQRGSAGASAACGRPSRVLYMRPCSVTDAVRAAGASSGPSASASSPSSASPRSSRGMASPLRRRPVPSRVPRTRLRRLRPHRPRPRRRARARARDRARVRRLAALSLRIPRRNPRPTGRRRSSRTPAGPTPATPHRSMG